MSSGDALVGGLNLLVRPALETDVAAITDIYADAVLHGTSSFEIEPPTIAEMSARRSVLLTGNYPYLVAETGDLILGYAYAGAYRTRPAYRGTVEDSVYVAPGWKGQGIGLALLGGLIEAASQRGFRQMVAVIGDSGSAGSIRLHERAGFRHVGVLEAVGHKHGRWLDTVLMQRSLAC